MTKQHDMKPTLGNQQLKIVAVNDEIVKKLNMYTHALWCNIAKRLPVSASVEVCSNWLAMPLLFAKHKFLEGKPALNVIIRLPPWILKVYNVFSDYDLTNEERMILAPHLHLIDDLANVLTGSLKPQTVIALLQSIKAILNKVLEKPVDKVVLHHYFFSGRLELNLVVYPARSV